MVKYSPSSYLLFWFNDRFLLRLQNGNQEACLNPFVNFIDKFCGLFL
jgi:hypothetical protein